jgi:hypothetical protein
MIAKTPTTAPAATPALLTPPDPPLLALDVVVLVSDVLEVPIKSQLYIPESRVASSLTGACACLGCT